MYSQNVYCYELHTKLYLELAQSLNVLFILFIYTANRITYLHLDGFMGWGPICAGQAYKLCGTLEVGWNPKVVGWNPRNRVGNMNFGTEHV